jgi:hypothetical protein
MDAAVDSIGGIHTPLSERLAEDSFVFDLELSYVHIGMAAGMRF